MVKEAIHALQISAITWVDVNGRTQKFHKFTLAHIIPIFLVSQLMFIGRLLS